MLRESRFFLIWTGIFKNLYFVSESGANLLLVRYVNLILQKRENYHRNEPQQRMNARNMGVGAILMHAFPGPGYRR